MLFYFFHLIYAAAAEAPPPIEARGDQVALAAPGQTEPMANADILMELRNRQWWLCLFQTASTVTDYTCQFTQIALTIPQLATHPSEKAGIWLNSFNLAAGVIGISQIPLKKLIQSRLTETEQNIARLQAELNASSV